MNHHYKDIRNLIDKEPEWWDENGVPTPEKLGSLGINMRP